MPQYCNFIIDTVTNTLVHSATSPEPLTHDHITLPAKTPTGRYRRIVVELAFANPDDARFVRSRELLDNLDYDAATQRVRIKTGRLATATLDNAQDRGDPVRAEIPVVRL